MSKMTYEQSIKRLDEIVSILETGEKSLDESLKLYEEGIKLSNECNQMLKSAEQKITEISKDE